MIWNRPNIVGSSLVGVGGLLLVLVALYAAYAWEATSSLDDLNVDRSESLTQLLLPGALQASGETEEAAQATVVPPKGEGLAIVDEAAPGTQERPDPMYPYSAPWVAAPDIGTTYPLTPLVSAAEGATLPGGGTGLQDVDLQAFRPVDWASLPPPGGALARPTRIQIPAIGLDSSIVQLNANWVGERLLWEIPKFVVGYHTGTASPGSAGNTVLSGHISTPLLREGAIFKKLPRVATLLGEGRIVDIIVTTSEARYLYRVTATEVSEPDDVDLFRPTKEPSLTLLTCVPDYVYSHRLLVNAILVGKAPLG